MKNTLDQTVVLNQKNNKTKDSKKREIVQVSLTGQFGCVAREKALATGRSVSSQLEHWARIAQAMENVVPSATLDDIKVGQSDSSILRKIGAFLIDSDRSLLVAELAKTKGPRYGVSESDPSVIIRVNEDGSHTTGSFDDSGAFVPTTSTVRNTHETRHGTEPPDHQPGRKISSKKGHRTSVVA